MDFQISVSTEVLTEKAEEISAGVDLVRREWEEIQHIVKSSENYWKGKSSKKHLKLLSKSEDEVNEIIKRLSEHPDDLLKMVGVYVSTENAIINSNSGLPTDVIV